MTLFQLTVLSVAGAAIGYAAIATGAMDRVVDFAETRVATSSKPDDVKRLELKRTVPEANERPRAGLRTVVLDAGRNGHFRTRAYINGRPVDVLADTGASMVVLSWEDAQRIGLRPSTLEFVCCVNTANGKAEVAPVTLDSIEIGHITVRNVKAAVGDRGALSSNLLGMTFIGELARFELSGNQLILEQ